MGEGIFCFLKLGHRSSGFKALQNIWGEYVINKNEISKLVMMLLEEIDIGYFLCLPEVLKKITDMRHPLTTLPPPFFFKEFNLVIAIICIMVLERAF